MNGFLNIFKPAGMTSHDVVARVRRLLKTKRAGHAGTLDPDAVGVLVVAVGQATRLLPHLPTEPKVYTARVCFGTATSTEDGSGTVIAEADASTLTEDALLSVLPKFHGRISQVPPMVSAVHHEGKRLYELARQGIEVEREARTVEIFDLRLSEFATGAKAEATLRVVCGGGTYIRTLCKDLGEAIGLPAHMKSLVRDAVGPFALNDAIALDDIAPDRLLPMEAALTLPMVEIDEEMYQRVVHGMSVRLTIPEDPEEIGLLIRERLCALARLMDGQYHPFKVLSD